MSIIAFVSSDASIVTPSTRKRTEDQVWQKEQYLHEVVILSLKGLISSREGGGGGWGCTPPKFW